MDEDFTAKAAGPFFPSTCHPSLSRRRFVAGGGALLGAAGVGIGAAPAVPDATALISAHAGSAKDPWAVAHGIRAMGREFTLQDGRRAVDFLLQDVLAPVTVGQRRLLAFALGTESHANSFLKTMLEAGVPLDYTFSHGGDKYRLQDIVDSAHALFRPREFTSDPQEIAWSLIALTRTTSPVRKRWTNAWRESVDLDESVEMALRALEDASAPLAAAMRDGRPMTAKAPVHSFTCGGTHMLYALVSATHYGFGLKGTRERVQQQVALMVWRTRADVDLMARFYTDRKRSRVPLASWYELDSKLKLLGHAEECFAMAVTRGVVTLAPAQAAQREEAVATVKRLLADPRLRNLAEVRAMNIEAYRQLVGDMCHARHGLVFA